MVQIDIESRAIGRNRPADLAVIGDAAASARALADELEKRGHRNTGFRTPELAAEIAAHGWYDDPYEDAQTEDFIDPRTLTPGLE